MNIQRNLVAAAVLAIGFGAAVPALADSDSTVTITKTSKHHYVYYGDHQIYFAPETKTYYWRRDGNWTSGRELPMESRSYVAVGGVDIDLDTDRPYERNEWVVAHYGRKHAGDRQDRDERHDGDRRDGDDKHDGDRHDDDKRDGGGN